MSYYNASWNSCFWFDGCFFNIKSSCLCIVLAIGRLWKSLCTQFVYFLSFYLLLMYILHAIYCVISLSAIINTPQLFQHDLFITLCHFLISFEHVFHPPMIHFLLFFFSLSLSCFHISSWIISWCLAWLLLLAVTRLYLTTKGESLPNLDRLLSPTLPQIPVNEPVRLAPVPAWRKVKSGTALPYPHRD